MHGVKLDSRYQVHGAKEPIGRPKPGKQHPEVGWLISLDSQPTMKGYSPTAASYSAEAICPASR
jgi:hypothetical protein